MPANPVSRELKPVQVLRTDAMFAGAARLPSRAWIAATDALLLVAMVVAIPFVILAVGTPVAAALQLLLWIGRLL